MPPEIVIREFVVRKEKYCNGLFILVRNQAGLEVYARPAYHHVDIVSLKKLDGEHVLAGGQWSYIPFSDNPFEIGGYSQEYGLVPLSVLEKIAEAMKPFFQERGFNMTKEITLEPAEEVSVKAEQAQRWRALGFEV